MSVVIQTRDFGAKRWRTVETVEADEAKAVMAERQRQYPMSDYRIAPIPKRRRRRIVREYF